MKRLLILFFSFLCLLANAQKNDDRFFENADAFFRKYVWDEKVNYLKISENTWLLDTLTNEIAHFEIDVKKKNRLKSFYCNAYQILVIKNVVAHYPISSVKEVPGFYEDNKFIVAGEKLSLNQILFDKLYKDDKDVRVLFSLANASVSGPKIYNTSFSAYSKINVDLDKRIKSLMNDNSFVRADEIQHTATVSQLFKWYSTEINSFYKNEKSFINNYRQENITPTDSVRYFDYDWSLNDQNENQVLTYAPVRKTKILPADSVAMSNQIVRIVQLRQSNSSEKNLSEINKSIIDKNIFDEELGFRNESRFIESKTFELRATDKFYTQDEFYNKELLRVSSDYRTTYNRVSFLGTYAFNQKFQGGLLYDTYKLYNDNLPAKAKDFFSAPAAQKFHVSELQFFSKYKWDKKKYRFSSIAYLSIPFINKRPNEKVAIGKKSYALSLQGFYDRYPTSFMRMILGAEFLVHYNISKEKATLDFNPESRFIFTLFRSKPVKFTAMMELLFSVNKEKVNPFTATESLVASISILYNLDCNLMYEYYMLGKDTGAGHDFKFELRYAFQ